MSDITEHRMLVEPGYQREMIRDYPLNRVALLVYPDGSVGVEHKCRVLDGVQIICAPRLIDQPGANLIESRNPWTIQQSISCSDCSLHGFVVRGRWHDA